MMRLAGRIEPGNGAGPVGQLGMARLPARTADAYDVASCALRPGLSFTLAESDAPENMRDLAVESDAAVAPEPADELTSPPAVFAAFATFAGAEFALSALARAATSRTPRHAAVTSAD